MVEYGVVTTNKFFFLSDDEGADPSEILGKAAQIKKVKGTSTTKVPTNTAPASTNLPKPEKPHTETANKENATVRGGRSGRGGRGESRGGRGGRGGHNDRSAGDQQNRSEDKPEGGEDHPAPRGGRGGNRGESRGRGGFRGGRGGNTGERREGNRPFRGDGEGGERKFGDRQGDGERRPYRERPPRDGDMAPAEGDQENRSRRRGGGRGGNFGDRADRGHFKTGVRGVEKKDGHGKGNWGTEQDELQGETEPIVEATDVEKPAQEEDQEKNDSGVEVEKEEEKQPVGMTLSEWKEKHKAVETETFDVRKPNDDKKLNLAPLKKVEDTQKDDEEYVVLRREPKKKHVDISVNFATTDRGFGDTRGRGRGGRGDFRGGRGGRDNFNDRSGGDSRQFRGDRDGKREGRGKQNFNLVNEQFPALGAQ